MAHPFSYISLHRVSCLKKEEDGGEAERRRTKQKRNKTKKRKRTKRKHRNQFSRQLTILTKNNVLSYLELQKDSVVQAEKSNSVEELTKVEKEIRQPEEKVITEKEEVKPTTVTRYEKQVKLITCRNFYDRFEIKNFLPLKFLVRETRTFPNISYFFEHVIVRFIKYTYRFVISFKNSCFFFFSSIFFFLPRFF